jgi:predicted permease
VLIPAFVLLIACANLAALMLARAAAQHRDLALRLALGARLRTLIADQLAEIGVVAVAGGLIGLGIADFIATWYAANMPGNFVGPGVIFDPHMNWRGVGFTFVAAVGAMAITTLLPAGHLALIQPATPLKEGSGATTGRAMQSLRHIVYFELALTMALLVVANLTLRGTGQIADVDLGFDASPLRTVRAVAIGGDTSVFGAGGAEAALLDRLRRVPGIDGATAFAFESGLGTRADSIHSAHTLASRHAMTAATQISAGQGVLATLRLPLLRGRDFDASDAVAGAAIIDERAAAVLFPGENALGALVEVTERRGGRGPRRWVPVVGVTKAARAYYWYELDDKSTGTIIVARSPASARRANIVLRFGDRPEATALEVQRTLQSVLTQRSYTEFGKFSSMDSDAYAVTFVANTFGFIGLSALVLAAIGVFGVVSYAVSQRMREFAVRIALGAQKQAVLALVLRHAALMSIGSTAIGAAIGASIGTVMRGFLFGVEPLDTVSLVRSAAVLIGVVIGACVVPAIHAMRANPVDVLRAS